MADHLREQLTDAAVAALTGLATTGSRVYEARRTPLPSASQPALLIELGPEPVAVSSISGGTGRGRLQEKSLDLVVKALVKAASGYLDTLDQVALEVEVALAQAGAFGGLCKTVQLSSMDVPELDGTGEKTVARLAMHFNLTYYTALGAPDIPR